MLGEPPGADAAPDTLTDPGAPTDLAPIGGTRVAP